MKPERLLFTLFLLYWAGVYGVTFFGSDHFKSQFRDTIPTGYRMFAPVTNTHYDVYYEFYSGGKLKEKFFISGYLEKQNEKSVFFKKSNFVRERLFGGLIKKLDYHYQKSLYDELYKQKENDFEKQVLINRELGPIVENLKNFSRLYLLENPGIIADSVSISVLRKPMVLPFEQDYKDDFTYKVGEKTFFQTSLNPKP